jgi:hypothetical protein
MTRGVEHEDEDEDEHEYEYDARSSAHRNSTGSGVLRLRRFAGIRRAEIERYGRNFRRCPKPTSLRSCSSQRRKVMDLRLPRRVTGLTA